MLTVHVDNQKYNIHIEEGALEQAGSWLQTIWKPQKVAVITDTNVAPLYAEKIMFQLRQADFEPVLSIVPEGETSKSLEQAAELYDFWQIMILPAAMEYLHLVEEWWVI